ncbi:hypothetical protein MLD38_018780 [Melastoma candidum]|uniref:Uncharacterized protein n=1 Tax=Melastoma candidum TaxID=119954 RepID=A0ACB9QU21_9MYRT|nr:hypothetical protein MLD38_018780 [Melastoma candidum]
MLKSWQRGLVDLIPPSVRAKMRGPADLFPPLVLGRVRVQAKLLSEVSKLATKRVTKCGACVRTVRDEYLGTGKMLGIVDGGFDEIDRADNDSSSEEEIGVQEKKAKENVMKNAMALRILPQFVSKMIYPRLYGLKKAKEAWSVLKKEFQGLEKVTSIKLQGLWRDFDNLAMKECEMMKDFFSRVVEIMN